MRISVPVARLHRSSPPFVVFGLVLLSLIASLAAVAAPAQAQPNGDGSPSTHGCPAGSVPVSGEGADLVCVTRSEETVDPQMLTEVTCPDGAAPVAGTTGSSLKCEVTETDVETNAVERDSTTTFDCPDGAAGTGSGPSLTCLQTTDVAQEVAPVTQIEDKCPAGTLAKTPAEEPLVCLGAGIAVETAPAYCDPNSVAPDLVVVDGAAVCSAFSTLQFRLACPDGYTGPIPVVLGVTACELIRSSVSPTVAENFTCGQLVEAGGEGAALKCLTKPVTRPIQLIAQSSCPTGSQSVPNSDPLACVATQAITTAAVTPQWTCSSSIWVLVTDDPSGDFFCRIPTRSTVASIATTSIDCPDGFAKTVSASGVLECRVVVFSELVPSLNREVPACSLSPGSELDASNPAAPVCVRLVPGANLVDPIEVDTLVCPLGSAAVGAPTPGQTPTCERVIEVVPTPTTTYSCPAGSNPVPDLAVTMICETTNASFTIVPATTHVVFGCSADFEASGVGATTTCSRSTTATSQVAPVAVGSPPAFVCPSGSSQTSGEGAATICTVETTVTEIGAVVETVRFECLDGTLVGDQCRVATVLTGAVAALTQTVLACPAGSDPIRDPDLRCSPIRTGEPVEPVPSRTLGCPDRSTVAQLEPLSCREASELREPASVEVTESCPEGYTLLPETSMCGLMLFGGVTAETVVTTEFSCPQGSTASGTGARTTCGVTGSANTAAEFTSACPTGATVDGALCVIAAGDPVAPLISHTPTCTQGVITPENPEQCLVSAATTIPASVTFDLMCPDGAILSASNDCLQPADKPISVPPVCKPFYLQISESCFDGLPTKTPTCPPTYSFDASGLCEREVNTVIEVPSGRVASSDCPDGASKSMEASGTMVCLKTSSATTAVDAVTTTTHSCPEGATERSVGAELVCEVTKEVTTRQQVASKSTTTTSCPVGTTIASGSGSSLVCSRLVEQIVKPVALDQSTDTPGARVLSVSASAANNLSLSDPYVCGAGFYGSVAGGTPPYRLSYEISSSSASFTLGTFMSTTSAYTTPPGYVDYAVIPDATYAVSISIVDAALQSIVVRDLFSARITQACGATAVPVATAAPSIPAQPIPLAVTGSNTSAITWALVLIASGASLMGIRRSRRIAGLVR